MLRGLKNAHLRPYLNGCQLVASASAGSANIGAGYFNSIGRAAGNPIGVLSLPHTAARNYIIPVVSTEDAAAAGAFAAAGSLSKSTVAPKAFNAAGTAVNDQKQNVLFVTFESETTNLVSPLQQVKNWSQAPRYFGARYDASTGLVGGSRYVTATKTATGEVTITFLPPFGRRPVVVATPIATTQKSLDVTAVTCGGCVIKTYDSSEAAEDNSFYIQVLGWDASYDTPDTDRVLQVPYRAPIIVAGMFTASGTTPTLVTGTGDFTVTHSGTTGEWTIGLTNAFAAEPIIIASYITTNNGRCQVKAAATKTGFSLRCYNAAGSDANGSGCSFIALGQSPTVTPFAGESGAGVG